MRLVQPKRRQGRRSKSLRIEISQAEITADLRYPARTRQVHASTAARPAAGR